MSGGGLGHPSSGEGVVDNQQSVENRQGFRDDSGDRELRNKHVCGKFPARIPLFLRKMPGFCDFYCILLCTIL